MAKIVKDPELQAMAEIAEQLDALAADARQRVTAWILTRYAPPAEPRPVILPMTREQQTEIEAVIGRCHAIPVGGPKGA